MSDTMKFGPRWLRELSDGGTNCPGGGSPGSSGGAAGGQGCEATSPVSINNTNNNTNVQPSPSSSAASAAACSAQADVSAMAANYKEPQYKYCRADILSLFPANCAMPTDIDNDLNYICVQKTQYPVSFSPVTEDEVKFMNQPANSNAILRKHTPNMPMLRSPSERGVGRGRGRGDGGFYLREEEPFSRNRYHQQRDWNDDSRGYNGRTYNPRQYDNHEGEPARSPYGTRQYDSYDGGEQSGNQQHYPFQRSTSSTDNWRSHADDEDEGWRKMNSKQERWRGNSSQMQSNSSWRNNDSYRNSYHEDRYATNFTNYPRKGENGNIPEWITEDNTTEIATGTFDASGAFVRRKDNMAVKKASRKLSLKLVTGAEGQHIISDITDSVDNEDLPEVDNIDLNKDAKDTKNHPKKNDTLGKLSTEPDRKNNISPSRGGGGGTPKDKTPKDFAEYSVTPDNYTMVPPQHMQPKTTKAKPHESTQLTSQDIEKNKKEMSLNEKALLNLENTNKNIMDWFDKPSFTSESALESPRSMKLNHESRENIDLSQKGDDELKDLWLYIDPKDKVQGPFNKQEMEDWFNAGYFTHDLRVKRTIDPSFVPLGYLIRKLGALPFRSEEQFTGATQPPPPSQQTTFDPTKVSYASMFNDQINSDADALLRNLNEAVTSSGEILPDIPISSSAMSVSDLEASQHHDTQHHLQQQQHPMMQASPAKSTGNNGPAPHKQIWNNAPAEVPVAHTPVKNYWPSPPTSNLPPQMSAQVDFKNEKELLQEQDDYEMEQQRNRIMQENMEAEIIEAEKMKLEMEKEDERMAKENERIAIARLAKQQEKDRKEKERLRLLEEAKIQEELKKERTKLRKKAEEEKRKKVDRQLERARAEEIAREQKEQELLKLEADKEAERRKQESIKKQQKLDDLKLPVSAGWATKPAAKVVGESLSNIQRNQIDKQAKKEKAEFETQKRSKAAQVVDQQAQSAKSWSLRVSAKSKSPAGRSSLLDIQNEQVKLEENTIAPSATPPPPAKKNITASTQSIKTWNSSPAQNESQTNKTKIKPLMDSLWDDIPVKKEQPFIVQKSKRSSKQQSTAAATVAAPAKPKEVKMKKEQLPDVKVKSLFEVNKDVNEFTVWCEKALKGISGNVDIPTFASFLNDIESPYEVRDYVKGYIGDNPTAAKFAEDFILARAAYKNKNSNSASKVSSKVPVLTNNERVDDQNDFVYVSGKGNKKNKKKMQKLDSSILGFTVHAAPDRINAGEIDYT